MSRTELAIKKFHFQLIYFIMIHKYLNDLSDWDFIFWTQFLGWPAQGPSLVHNQTRGGDTTSKQGLNQIRRGVEIRLLNKV